MFRICAAGCSLVSCCFVRTSPAIKSLFEIFVVMKLFVRTCHVVFTIENLAARKPFHKIALLRLSQIVFGGLLHDACWNVLAAAVAELSSYIFADVDVSGADVYWQVNACRLEACGIMRSTFNIPRS